MLLKELELQRSIQRTRKRIWLEELLKEDEELALRRLDCLRLDIENVEKRLEEIKKKRAALILD